MGTIARCFYFCKYIHFFYIYKQPEGFNPWYIGYGMDDDKGHNRNLSTIYTINSPDWKGEKKDNISGDEHFISHISCSYMDKKKKNMKTS